jgi:uncharacterized membrane protein YvlD (DUF360 family)
MFGLIIRFISAAITLAITALLIPSFKIDSLKVLVFAVIVIAALDFLVAKIFKLDASPFGRGIVGFLLTAAILYCTKFIITEGYEITIITALIGAVVYGIINAIIPGKALFEKGNKSKE